MNIRYIEPPSKDKWIEKYGPLELVSFIVRQTSYSGYGTKLTLDEILPKLTIRTRSNIRYLLSKGVKLDTAYAIIIDQAGKVRWSIPIFGTYNNDDVVFWRKEGKCSMSGQTVLSVGKYYSYFNAVRKMGINKWLRISMVDDTVQSNLIKIKQSDKSIDQVRQDIKLTLDMVMI